MGFGGLRHDSLDFWPRGGGDVEITSVSAMRTGGDDPTCQANMFHLQVQIPSEGPNLSSLSRFDTDSSASLESPWIVISACWWYVCSVLLCGTYSCYLISSPIFCRILPTNPGS